MAISNLWLVMWWQSFPQWSMVSQLDIMIISKSDTNGRLVFRFTSNLCVVLLFCSCDGPHSNDSLFLILLFLEAFVQVITDINDAVSGAVTCEIFESDCIRSCFFLDFFCYGFWIKFSPILNFWCSIVFSWSKIARFREIRFGWYQLQFRIDGLQNILIFDAF